MKADKLFRHAGFPLTALFACSLLIGCSDDEPSGSGTRADAAGDAARDTGRADTTSADTGTRDTGTADRGTSDTGGTADTGATDSGPPEDTGVADSGPPEDTGTTDTGTGDTTTADTSTGDLAGGCDVDGFTAVADFAVRFDDEDPDIPDAMFYRGFTTEDEPWDEIDMEFYDLDTDWPGAGSFDFTGENYAECFTCALLFTGCTEANVFCDAVFLITEGSLEITAIGEVGGDLTGTLTDAQFVEVEIDWDDTFESTIVPGGQTWCVDSYSFDVEVEAPEE